MLSVTGLTASYGSSQALFDVDLSIGAGEVVALLGRNGMGKSTTVKAICRMMPSRGQLVFQGHDLGSMASHQVARLGVGLVPEGRRCFADLTVRENLIAAARAGYWTVETTSQLFPRLGERLEQRAAALSGGEQQMLAIGRALMTNPNLLILDEATEGLAPIVRQEIWDAVKRLKIETGLSILLIDKSLKELSAVSDTFYIIERGRTVWSGLPVALRRETSDRYLGV